MKFPPTPEQQAILDAALNSDTSLMVNAMAGCAKTTTLELLANAMPVRPSLALAFNVKIKKELEARFPDHFKVMTLNGLGHNAFCKAINKRVGVETRKLGNILKEILKREKIETSSDEFSGAIQIVNKARQLGMIPQGLPVPYTGLIPDDERGWEAVGDALYLDLNETQIFIARSVLRECVIQSYRGVIDYDDQIYMSALFGGVFPKYPVVMVDESQDLSPLNHIQVARSAADRLIVVGDPRQAIYAFRGADSASMDKLRDLREVWTDRPLSTTFRCPKAVVARQQSHAPGFTAAPSAPQGEVISFLEKEEWGYADLPAEGQIAILCRNNAPLFSAALRLIKKRIGCTLMGSEIGKALATLSKKILPEGDMSAEDCLVAIHAWKESEVAKARAQDKEERVAIINEKAECLEAVIVDGEAKTASDILRILGSMFEANGLRVLLASGHKSKGLEWDVVVHLDPWRVPSKYAKAALAEGNRVPMEQDLNLRYVIETRTKKILIMANLEQMA